MTQLNPMEDFQRDISYRLLKKDDATALLTATLKDRFHDIVAEVVVEVASLKIISARAEFRKSPTPDCGNVSARMRGLAGFVIGRGLQRKLSDLFGGGEGCGNMRNLLMGLLPLAMNLKAAVGINSEQEMMDAIHEKLAGTCAGYETPPGHGKDTLVQGEHPKEAAMSWFYLGLDSGQVAAGELAAITERFTAAFGAAGGPRAMALFRKEGEAGGVDLFFTPDCGIHAAAVLKEAGAAPCEGPSLAGLQLLVGHNEITYYLAT